MATCTIHFLYQTPIPHHHDYSRGHHIQSLLCARPSSDPHGRRPSTPLICRRCADGVQKEQEDNFGRTLGGSAHAAVTSQCHRCSRCEGSWCLSGATPPCPQMCPSHLPCLSFLAPRQQSGRIHRSRMAGMRHESPTRMAVNLRCS